MEEKLFLDQRKPPTDRSLRAGLGPAYQHYTSVSKAAASYSQDWTFTRSGGWMLKVWRAKKALLYLIPLRQGLKVSLAIRETERAALLEDDDLEAMRDKLVEARRFSEGFALQFKLVGDRDHRSFDLFLRRLMDLRK
jgi:hypothetical protein